VSGQIELTSLTGVKINGKVYENPYLEFRYLWDGPEVWMWNEFIRNPEALAEYFEENRYPAGNWENKDGQKLDSMVRSDFYLKLDYARRALVIAYDSKKIYEEMYGWFYKFWKAYKEPIEKVFPQFDDKNYSNPTVLEQLAKWSAKVVANTFVKYGPNAFLTLMGGLLATIKVDNEWLEVFKYLSEEKYPQLMDLPEFQRFVKRELPISDKLYVELRNIYLKWRERYAPHDQMTLERINLLDTFQMALKNRYYFVIDKPSFKRISKQILEDYNNKLIGHDNPQVFKELSWAISYMYGPDYWQTDSIAPPGFKGDWYVDLSLYNEDHWEKVERGKLRDDINLGI